MHRVNFEVSVAELRLGSSSYLLDLPLHPKFPISVHRVLLVPLLALFPLENGAISL